MCVYRRYLDIDRLVYTYICTFFRATSVNARGGTHQVHRLTQHLPHIVCFVTCASNGIHSTVA